VSGSMPIAVVNVPPCLGPVDEDDPVELPPQAASSRPARTSAAAVRRLIDVLSPSVQIAVCSETRYRPRGP
jgi:hypothetical protein